MITSVNFKSKNKQNNTKTKIKDSTLMCNFTWAINKFHLVRKQFTLTGIVMMCSQFFLAKKGYCVPSKKT